MTKRAAHPRRELRAAVRTALARGSMLLPGLGLMLAQPPARAADLPVPCVSGTCGANGPAVWVTSGAAGSTITGNHLDVRQESDRAILNWASFDVGKNNSVSFTQPSESAIALNRIYQQSPSQILGTVTANGQIYLINPNGILFGKDSQVNVGSLVASTLDVSDEVFNGVGIARAVDQGQPALQGGEDMGSIEVEAGAKLSAASGGRILIFAPQIENAGKIETPDGQAILAASKDTVYLQASDDPNLRGLLVEVGTGGDVRNVGQIVAERGNATIMGLAVNQEGLVSATTTVRANGSVRLLARDGAVVINQGGGQTTLSATNAGTLTLAAGSTTEVQPELDDDGKAVDEQAQRPSTIELLGRTVVLEGGSKVLAPGGDVSFTATANPAAPVADNTPRNDSLVRIDEGSLIDVSGVDSVVLPMERNTLDVELRANELADSPLQREGVLRGEKVTIDVRVGTPLANVSGAIATIERGVGERLSAGGTVSIASEGEVVVSRGATIDVSGGQIRFADGFIDTTRVVADGVIYDIGEADPSRIYDGIADGFVKFHERWGVTEIFSGFGVSPEGRFEAGYLEGKDAGTLSIRAYDALLDGTFLGGAVAGLHQRLPPGTLAAGLASFNRPYTQAPLGGRLVLDLAIADDSARDVSFVNEVSAVVPELPFPVDRVLELPVSLFGTGALTRLEVTTNGRVELPGGVTLVLGPGGQLAVSGGAIAIDGGIEAHGGDVELTAQVPAATSAPIALGEQSRIDVSGDWVNDSPLLGQGETFSPVFVDGGNVELSAHGDLTFSRGATIDASGGAWLQAGGTLVAGHGGDVSLTSALDGADTTLVLDGELSAYALQDGGTVHVEANSVRIEPAGGDPADPSDPGAPVELVLAPEFFRRGGFSSYEIAANRGALTVAPGTLIEPRTENRLLGADFMLRATGSDLAGFSTLGFLPDQERTAASIALTLDQSTALTVLPGNLEIGAGATIRTDPGASVALASDRSLYMNGTIDASAGSVQLSITLPGAATDPGFDATQAIFLGDDASILARGAVVMLPNDQGLRTGRVLPAGTVELSTKRGYIVTAPGSVIDVSGTAQPLDVVRASRGGNVVETVQGVAPAGTIAFSSAEGMLLNGALVARPADVDGAAGGTLALTVDGAQRDVDEADFSFGFGARSVRLTSGRGPTIVEPGTPIPESFNGVALLGVETVEDGGFDVLSLSARSLFSPRDQTHPASFGTIRLDPGVDLSLRRAIVLDAPVLEVAAGADARLDAAYVLVGPDNVATQEIPAVATPGDGTLHIGADLLELTGNILIDGADSVELASRGDLRLQGARLIGAREFTGSLTLSADLTLQADQIYPTTLSTFVVNVVDRPEGMLRIAGGDAPTPVLSAGGVVRMNAPNIEQGGVIKAPLGQIELAAVDTLTLAAGGLTSTSTEGQIIPFGRTQGGIDWTYPLGDQTLLFDVPPAQRVRLEARAVDVTAGAVIDASGGGDLNAYEFVPGPGGSRDVLDPASGSWAILPGLALAYAPFDPLESPTSGLTPGDSLIVADGVAGLPAGAYALLPARYALLPGAFLVTPVDGTLDVVPGEALTALDGLPIVAARHAVASTDIEDSRWTGFAVETGAQVRERAEYTESRASDFFAARALAADEAAPRLPADAGTLTFAAAETLQLAGELRAAAAEGGLGGRADVQAERIAVVANETGAEGVVELRADSLSTLGIESLLLGGTRSDDEEGTRVNVTASEVTVGMGAVLTLPEILLAAHDDVRIEAGAEVAATGALSEQGAGLHTQGDGAFLLASAGDATTFLREDAAGAGGVLDVAEGATLSSDGALLLDASLNTRLEGELHVNGTLTLGANRIGLGDGGADFDGLLLSVETLAALGVDALNLLSRSSIDLFGDLDVAVGALTFDSAALVGHGAAGEQAHFAADQVLLTNTGASLAETEEADDAAGAGTLVIESGDIVLGAGAYALQGFADHQGGGDAPGAALSASGAIASRDEGTLTSESSLTLRAGRITGETGAALTVDAGEHTLSIDARGPAPTQAPDSLGASIALAAGEIDDAGRIELPGGRITLTARSADRIADDGAPIPSLRIGDGAVIDASGIERRFDETDVAAPAGSVTLAAEAGDVSIAEGAVVRLDGVGNGDAGRLSISAPLGAAHIDGTISAHAESGGGGLAGAVDLDVATLEDFSRLNAALDDAGMFRERDIRVRKGALEVGEDDVVRADSITLSTDLDNISVAGTIDASGERGGVIALLAGRNVTLRSGGVLDASATGEGESGGRIDLESDRDDGEIRLNAGSSVLLAGGAGGGGGELHLRAVRGDAALEPRISIAGGVVSGAGATPTLEAVQVYEDADGIVNANDVSTYLNDAAAFMAIPPDFGPDLVVLPGIEVQRRGDLALATPVDLLTQRYGGQAGALTLRAAGDLTLGADLSDGLLSGFDVFGNPLDSVQTGPSWSYRLIGGADFHSSDALATVAGAGNVTIGSGVTVRTGTGDLSVAAGADIVLTDAGSTVYTAGESTGAGTLPFEITSFFGVDYPVNGGDLTLRAGGDILSAGSRQLVNDWLHRLGGAGSTGVLPTVWGVSFANFAQNAGALGGGDVHVEAGGDIVNLSVSLPTTAQHQGDASFDGTSFVVTDNRFLEQGGGDLDVVAGGDIRGGTYFVGKGTGTVRAGGDIIAPDGSPLSLVLALGDAQFDVQAGGDLVLETAINPMVLPQSTRQFISDLVQSLFFTYTADAAVRLTALGGDVELHNDGADLVRAIDLIFPNLTAQSALTVYPGTLSAVSMQGDMLLAAPFTLFPTANGNFDLLAWRDVSTTGVGSVTINLSDTDPSLLPGPLTPAVFFTDAHDRLAAVGRSDLIHAAIPVHVDDETPSRLVAQTGSIDPPDDLRIYTAESMRVLAGGDIRNADLHVQNLDPDDLTLIQAGRDVAFTSQRGAQGEVTANTRTIEVAGPGQAQVIAGRNIDLGTSGGITTIGDQANPALADSGADLTVITGFTGDVDEVAFRDAYVTGPVAGGDGGGRAGALADDPASDHQKELEAYVQELLGDPTLTGEAARDAFLALDSAKQRPLLLSVLFDELRDAGSEGALGDTEAFEPGFAAIHAMFPEDGHYDGNLSLFFSRIQTFDGGDVNLVVPGGLTNAGLAATFAGAKPPSELGIVAQRDGSISAFVDGDFLVNQSRVFALDGGDILIWSSEGDIDAGRGAKSALAAPPPTVTFDANGNVVVEFPPAISGSGIRAAVSTPGREPGDVFLFAPTGVVNAGDAGIGSAGNITIAATEVIGAENIDVGGVAVGVPVDTGGIAAALTGVSSVGSSAAKSAEETATSGSAQESNAAPLGEAALGWLDVFILGFGEEGQAPAEGADQKKEEKDKEKKDK